MRGIGQILWTVPLAEYDYDGLSLSPGGVLYALDDGGTVVVAIGLDGSILWRSALGVRGTGPPAIGPDGTLYYGYWQGESDELGGIAGMGPDGTRRWIFETFPHRPCQSAWYHVHAGATVGTDGTLYFVSEEDDAPVYAVNPDGTLKWRTAMVPEEFGRMGGYVGLIGDSLVVAYPAHLDSVVALDARTGEVRWNAFAGLVAAAWQPGFAIGADGTIYSVAGGYLRAFTPEGVLQWRNVILGEAFAASAAPTIGKDRVYLATMGGGVQRYDLQGNHQGHIGQEDRVSGVVTVGANDVLYVLGPDTLFSYGPEGVRFTVPVSNRRIWEAVQGGPVIGPMGRYTFAPRASA